MLQSTIKLLILSSSMIFIQIDHPLAMGLVLLIQTILISLTIGTLAKTFWFSYILFLVFLGGMLVLFIYVTSLASNEMFSLSMKMTTTIITLATITMIIIMITDPTLTESMLQNNEMNELSSINALLEENMLTLNKLYNYPTNLVTLLLISYLLISLIAIVKITNVFYGPLRQMN